MSGMIDSLLGGIAACTKLKRLRLNGEGSFVLQDQLAPLTPLQSLAVPWCKMAIRGSVGGLPRLADLRIRGRVQAPLLASLTRLDLNYLYSGYDGHPAELPAEVGQLPRLRHLALKEPSFNPDSYTALLSLTALERLELAYYKSQWPPCILQLSWLRALTLAVQDDWGGGLGGTQHIAGICQALPRLTQLTELTLPLTAEVVPVLDALRHLRSLFFLSSRVEVDLPAGRPWLPGVERLVAPFELLRRSKAALLATPRLDQLGVMLRAGLRMPQINGFLRLIAKRGQLHRLVVFRYTAHEDDMKTLQELIAERSHPTPPIELCWYANLGMYKHLRDLDRHAECSCKTLE